MDRFEVCVIGGGIAGVSVAAHLAPTRRVVLVEAEPTLAFHTTGRSAALYFENYGHLSIRSLSKASRRYFEHPPDGTTDGPLLARRGALTLARPHQMGRLEQMEREGREAGTDVHRLTPAEAAARVPVIRPELLDAALWEPEAADMDVAAIHQSFVRTTRAHGGEIRTSSPVTELTHGGSGWLVRAHGSSFAVDVVVDAAGAWGDAVAALAGIAPVGLTPKRRTAFMVSGEDAWRGWPLVVDADHDFYFKPDGVQLLCSLADETPSEPCDAKPEQLDVALAIERINEATTLGIRSVRSEWAGLRTFVPDGGMAIGFDPDATGFFWLVGQGGTGIQTAPAAGMLAAALISGDSMPDLLEQHDVDPSSYAVARFRTQPD
jgi:D-arginine dehydrogenase